MVQVAMTDVKTISVVVHLGLQLKQETYTASAGEGVFANTSGGAWTLTLPAGTIGDEVSFYRLCRNI